MISLKSNAKNILFFLFVFFSQFLQAKIPEGYYVLAQGKSGAELKTALHNIIRQHTILNYDTSTSVWWYTYFKTTDWHPEGYFWDMYSNNKRSTYDAKSMNREHCMPRSWWATSDNYSLYDANGDLVNLSPSDAEANSKKSNYPLGEVGKNSVTYTNGVVKVGANSFPGYNGTVFEPADEYKGDFARTYMYMVTCYEDYANNWRGTGTVSMLQKNTYPVFKSWAIELLLKWSTNDPVSQKEINRNEGVYQIQKNRNPFIDYPELAEFIWGTKNSEQWQPEIGTSTFVVSPNPASSYVSVQISQPEQATFIIYDLSGIRLKNGKINSDGTIYIGDLNNGIYLLTIYAQNTRTVTKLIVTHEKLIQN